MLKSKLLTIVATVLTVCLTLTAFGCKNSSVKNNGDGFFTSVKISQVNSSAQNTPSIEANPSKKVEISLLSGEIYKVCSDYELYITDEYNAENTDVFAPTPLEISWTSKDAPLYYILDVSTNEDMTRSKSYVTFSNSVTLEHLFMGYDYYYQIQAKFDDRIVKSKIFKFSTAYLPRTVFIDEKVSNTRDWGGYVCKNGTQRVKQGIVYRGGKIEDITPKGKDVMLNVLGIKTDLDTRGDGTAGTSISPLGNTVNYIETTGPYYLGQHGIDRVGEYRDALITEIKAFAKPENFPIYVHCTLGRDRTGTICFLINALLGVGDIDLFRDYEISMMSKSGRLDSQTAINMVGGSFREMYNYVRYYKNNATLSESVEAFMLDIGISSNEIESIKNNMLEEIK